jgi:hypothetical protein
MASSTFSQTNNEFSSVTESEAIETAGDNWDLVPSFAQYDAYFIDKTKNYILLQNSEWGIRDVLYTYLNYIFLKNCNYLFFFCFSYGDDTNYISCASVNSTNIKCFKGYSNAYTTLLFTFHGFFC